MQRGARSGSESKSQTTEVQNNHKFIQLFYHFSLLFDEDLRKLCAFNILGNFSFFFRFFATPWNWFLWYTSLVPCCNIEFCCFCACEDLRNSFHTQLSARTATSAGLGLEKRNVGPSPHTPATGCHSGLKWKLIRKFNLQTKKNRIFKFESKVNW